MTEQEAQAFFDENQELLRAVAERYHHFIVAGRIDKVSLFTMHLSKTIEAAMTIAHAVAQADQVQGNC